MIELSTPVNKRACIAQWFGAVARRMLVIFAFVLVAGCASTVDDLVPDKNMVAVPIGSVGHYGSGVVVTDFSVNGRKGNRTSGWGGGLAGDCCVLLPRKIPKEPMLVTVKWATSRSNVPEYREHEATVPVHYSVEPGRGSGLYVHFLPGHRVEVGVSWPSPASPEYPGPAYPDGPAPLYLPLPNEQPQPAVTSKR